MLHAVITKDLDLERLYLYEVCCPLYHKGFLKGLLSSTWLGHGSFEMSFSFDQSSISSLLLIISALEETGRNIIRNVATYFSEFLLFLFLPHVQTSLIHHYSKLLLKQSQNNCFVSLLTAMFLCHIFLFQRL